MLNVMLLSYAASIKLGDVMQALMVYCHAVVVC
jgi:hypothetical protein